MDSNNGIEDRTKVWKMSTIVEILNARVSNIVTRRGGREWKGRDGKNGKIKTAFAEKGRNAWTFSASFEHREVHSRSFQLAGFQPTSHRFLSPSPPPLARQSGESLQFALATSLQL